VTGCAVVRVGNRHGLARRDTYDAWIVAEGDRRDMRADVTLPVDDLVVCTRAGGCAEEDGLRSSARLGDLVEMALRAVGRASLLRGARLRNEMRLQVDGVALTAERPVLGVGFESLGERCRRRRCQQAP
jgi:hypothetical protein